MISSKIPPKRPLPVSERTCTDDVAKRPFVTILSSENPSEVLVVKTTVSEKSLTVNPTNSSVSLKPKVTQKQGETKQLAWEPRVMLKPVEVKNHFPAPRVPQGQVQVENLVLEPDIRPEHDEAEKCVLKPKGAQKIVEMERPDMARKSNESDRLPSASSQSSLSRLENHTLKEKERRVRIKESCEKLRVLLPYIPGRKMDMASILEHCVDFLDIVIKQLPYDCLQKVEDLLIKRSKEMPTDESKKDEERNLNWNHIKYQHVQPSVLEMEEDYDSQDRVNNSVPQQVTQVFSPPASPSPQSNERSLGDLKMVIKTEPVSPSRLSEAPSRNQFPVPVSVPVPVSDPVPVSVPVPVSDPVPVLVPVRFIKQEDAGDYGAPRNGEMPSPADQSSDLGPGASEVTVLYKKEVNALYEQIQYLSQRVSHLEKSATFGERN